MSSDRPAVSFLVPAHNAARYLGEALASIAAQTDQDFEAVVVDDGSTDDTAAVARAWAERDPRFVFFSHRCGSIGAALNCAFSKARGRLFARMDADDRSQPERLIEQRAWLDQRPNVAICGSWARTFGVGGHHTWRPPTDDDHIRAALFFDAVMLHPSILMRREVLAETEGYRPEMSPAEDFDLWVRRAGQFRFANVPKVLLQYRLHPEQATAQRARAVARANLVRERSLVAWWPGCGAMERKFHLDLCAGSVPTDFAHFVEAEKWLRLLLRRPPPFGASIEAWRDTVAVRWLEACRHFRGLGLRVIARYRTSPLRVGRAVEPRREARLLWDTVREWMRRS